MVGGVVGGVWVVGVGGGGVRVLVLLDIGCF